MTDLLRFVDALKQWFLSVDPTTLVLASGGLLLAGLALKALKIVLWDHRRAGLASLGEWGALRREARMLVEQGSLPRAGRIYQTLGDYDQAIALYTESGSHRELGQLFEQLKQWEAAAQAYEAASEPERAALMLQKTGEGQRGAELLRRAGKSLAAAEAFEKAGCIPEAARLYEESGHIKRAADLYEKAEQWSKAAELFEQEFFHEQQRLQKRSGQVGTSEALAPLALRVGRLWGKAGNPGRAAEMFGRQGFLDEAADAFAQAGASEKAGELYLTQRQYDQAAAVFDRLGDGARRDAAMAEARLERGEVRAAADLFASSRQHLRAAELYEQVNEHEHAAEMYAAAGDHKRAGELYVAAGCGEKAAAVLEQGHQFRDAARLYLKLDQLDRAAAMFREAEDWFEAGRLCHRLGQVEAAIEVLQHVDSQSDTYYDASLELATIFMEQGMLSAAKDRYQKLLTIKRDSEQPELEPLYHLARIYEQEGDLDGARLLYEKILAQDFSFRDVRERIAEVKNAKTQIAPKSPAVPPAVASRYAVLKQIGQGGMGVVYCAEDTVLHRIVAYKVLPMNAREQPELVDNFLQEARITASINHPNIVTIFDTGRDANGNVFIAMEFVDGMSLKELLDKVGPLPLPQFLLITKQICAGLAYAHGRQIMHRDIKPSNIMLSRDRMVKIMDFGLAKIMNNTLTEKTSVKGTPLYMAPEQILGKEVDHQSDLYALGCTLYRMATGRLPFTKGDLYYHHLHTLPAPPKTLNPKLPPTLNTVILHCLEKDKTKRYQRVADILDDIEQVKLAA